MNKPRRLPDVQQKQNNLYTDYKAEILALNLHKYYHHVDKVFLKRLGSKNRTIHKDIENITSQLDDLGEWIISIETYREGIYDYLPEGLFHPPSLGDNRNHIDHIISQIQKQKQIERNARKLFQPFELESYFLELNALKLESEFDILENSHLLIDTIHDLWPLLKVLDKDSARIFTYMLPFFHSVRANSKWLEKCLMAFLKIPVKIAFVANTIQDIDKTTTTLVLSHFRLGINTVLSGTHLDGERNWAFYYGPIPYQDLAKYMPQSSLRKLLNIIYDYCLPLTAKVEEKFVMEKNEQCFIINPNQDTSRLGFSTFL